jgi:galactitol-specific phosphotransferase system IIB component
MMASKPRKKRKAVFLVACGTSIATSTMVIETLVEELVRQRKHRVDFKNCKVSELAAKIDLYQPDVVITTAPVAQKVLGDIIYFRGTPFLTGIGKDPLMEEIYELLEEWGV